MNKQLFITGLFFLLLFVSCNSKKSGTGKTLDTPSSGNIHIAVDESFSPIIDLGIDVFEHRYPLADIAPLYLPETDAVSLLIADSVRLAVLARPLTEYEKKQIKDRNLNIREQRLAIDGVAFITNRQNPDSLISVAQLQKILSGEIDTWKQLYPQSKLSKMTVVFDNSRSSTLRFLRDSLCKDTALTDKLYAQKTNAEVIDYVSRNRNAIGIIGAAWIDNSADTTGLLLTDKVRVMNVSATEPADEENSRKPYQGWLALREYPFTRDVFIVTTDARRGLPSGFFSFMTGETGQRIIGKTGLVPANMQIFVREVSIVD